jgi:putative PIN family toxin of toxin-antitoxin system
MKRAVFDTNLIASGLAGYRRDESTPGALLRRWFARDFTLVMSEPLLTEVKRTLAKPYFVATTTPANRTFMLSALREQTAWTDLTTIVSGIATHPEDDLVLATAVSASADYLVTGDGPLQRLRHDLTVPIISPRDFLTLLEETDKQAMSHEE